MESSASAPVVVTTLEEEGRLLWLELNRPRGNILDKSTLRELKKALADHLSSPRLKLIVLRGRGGNFSYGASVPEHKRELAPAMLGALEELAREIATCPVPVAALVEGRCLGGAFELVLCCHLVFATPNAQMGCPEIKLGVFAPILAVAGPHCLGSITTERLMLSGDSLPAEQARNLGFVAEILPQDSPRDALVAWFQKKLGPLSAFSIRQNTRAVRQFSPLCRALKEDLPAATRQYVTEVLESHDGNEGIEAFLEKRPPAWKDR